MSSSFLNIINCNENDSVGDLKDIIHHFEKYMNKYINAYYSQTEYRGTIKFLEYDIPDAYIKKYKGVNCAQQLYNYINSGSKKRQIYGRCNQYNHLYNLPKIKFDINHIAIANKNGDYMNTICDTEVGEPKKIILPVIIPMKNINELDTELRIKSQISTLEKEKINIQQKLNFIKLDIQTEKDNYTNIIKDNNIKKDLQNKEIENLNIQFTKLKEENQKELITIKDTIDGIYRNEIYDNEYTFEESKYIIKEPMIHLKDSFNHKNISLNFPILIKLQENEYVINHYIISLHNNKRNGFYDFSGKYDCNKFIFVLYITNYGRIIKSDIAEFYISEQNWKTTMGNYPCVYYDVCVSSTKKINNGKLISYFTQTTIEYSGCNNYGKTIDCVSNIEYKLTDQPKLNYRIPRLFIDVIDAFHTQNTDLMQECCKKYLEISRESKIKDSILKDLELNNKLKEKDNIIKSKDLELEDKNKVIESQQQEINKLKEELMKFKKSLSNLIGE